MQSFFPARAIIRCFDENYSGRRRKEHSIDKFHARGKNSNHISCKESMDFNRLSGFIGSFLTKLSHHRNLRRNFLSCYPLTTEDIGARCFCVSIFVGESSDSAKQGTSVTALKQNTGVNSLLSNESKE
jgi:hypothetical protein